jgi:hypothetical protein
MVPREINAGQWSRSGSSAWRRATRRRRPVNTDRNDDLPTRRQLHPGVPRFQVSRTWLVSALSGAFDRQPRDVIAHERRS